LSDNAISALDVELENLSYKITHSAKNGKDEIFTQINNAGGMGRLNTNNEIQLDFHALYVKEVKEKFDQLVLPVLPVVKSMVLITGHGYNRDKGYSVNHQALWSYIKKNKKNNTDKYAGIDCEKVQTNPGAIRVIYQKPNVSINVD
jgi:hypothetical protein